MCLIALAWQPQSTTPLRLIANRDEFHAREAAPLAFWADRPDLCAGRDLREGGTWMGVHRAGRFAAVTNVRELGMAAAPLSRGKLVSDFLLGHDTAAAHAEALLPEAKQYGGCNLLLWDGRELVWFSNRPHAQWQRVTPGIHGLSNAQLDTPWPKTGLVQTALQHWIASGNADPAPLFEAMSDRRTAPDAQLPDTGVGLETERLLSAPFIWRPGYGTRCTTFVELEVSGKVRMSEHSFDSNGHVAGKRQEDFVLKSHQTRRVG